MNYRPYILVSLIVIICGAMAMPARSSSSSRLAYAIRYAVEDRKGVPTPVAALDQIETVSDTVINSWPISPAYNSLSVIDDRTIALCMTASPQDDRWIVGIFDVQSGSFVKEITTARLVPEKAIAIPPFLVVTGTWSDLKEVDTPVPPTKRSIQHPAIEVYSLKDFSFAYSFELLDRETFGLGLGMSAETSKIYLATRNTGRPLDIMYGGRLYEFDAAAPKIQEVFNYTPHFGGVQGIIPIPNGNIMVISQQTTAADGAARHDLVYVISIKTGKIIKCIPAVYAPYAIVSAPRWGKAYVANSKMGAGLHDMAVIDVESLKVVGKLEIPGFRTMNYVGNGKLYVSSSGGASIGPGSDPGILVIDVKTNKIIKKISGEYAPISFHPRAD